ncbi:hypothetical protein LQK80_32395 [Bacillus thuringiensis]|nr:hypothetical protein [Bacillus thuringiensis]
MSRVFSWFITRFSGGKRKLFYLQRKGYIVFDFSKEEDILKFVQYIPEGYHWLKYHFDLNELSQIELEKLKEVLVNQYRKQKQSI